MKKLNRRTILGLAVGLALATRTKARAEESTTPWEWVLPSEGHLFNLNDNVKIKFTGPENELYSLKVTPLGGGDPQTAKGTMIQGQAEVTFGAGVLSAGDYVAKCESVTASTLVPRCCHEASRLKNLHRRNARLQRAREARSTIATIVERSSEYGQEDSLGIFRIRNSRTEPWITNTDGAGRTRRSGGVAV